MQRDRLAGRAGHLRRALYVGGKVYGQSLCEERVDGSGRPTVVEGVVVKVLSFAEPDWRWERDTRRQGSRGACPNSRSASQTAGPTSTCSVLVLTISRNPKDGLHIVACAHNRCTSSLVSMSSWSVSHVALRAEVSFYNLWTSHVSLDEKLFPLSASDRK